MVFNKRLKGIKKTDVTVRPLHNSSFSFGEHYWYSCDNNKISLVYPCFYTSDMFEIFCLKGNLFEDIERYGTLKEAENRINELFGKPFKFGRL